MIRICMLFLLCPLFFSQLALAIKDPLQREEVETTSMVPSQKDPLRVMTYNVYVGGSHKAFLTNQDPSQIPKAIADLYNSIITSNFAARAESIAKIVKDSQQPHIIGLQEISLIRRQDISDYLTNGIPNAEDIVLDFLTILMNALQAEELDYQVAAKVQNLDLEMPMLTADHKLIDVRLTDFDVILARKDVLTSRSTAANYAIKLQLPPEQMSLEVTRGFVAVDANVNGITYRIVNTHLESEDQRVRMAQAQELVTQLQNEHLPIILLGDFNTEAPNGLTYQFLLAAGYNDVWVDDTEEAPSGMTCCQAEDLQNEVSELSMRIDLILVKGDGFLEVDSSRTFTVGDLFSDRHGMRLWPSDHAGIVSILHLTPPDLDPVY